ncbi:MAG: PD40 domain-containing protein, partial [Bacteroidetes bacterium]|nr:PD40 domain-containing protein [Bacteroidota bacterium]
MKNKTFFLVILLFSLKLSLAQKDFKSAEKAVQQGHFFDAMEDYKKAYNESKKEDQKPFISFKVAECYRLMGDYKEAEEWYTKAVKANYTDSKALFYLGEVKKAQGKYAEATVDFTSYQTASPTDKGGQDALKSCELAQMWKDKPTRYKVESVTTINTVENDFFPTYADKKYNRLYFISTRTGALGKGLDPANGKLCGDIFDAQMEKNGNYSAAVPLPEPINTKEIEGGCLVTKKADMLFFSRSADKTNSQLWFANKVGLVWGEPEKINFCVETSNYLAPSISDDGLTLLFASNLPEGQGDNDIWMSKYDKATKKWGPPTNLGPDINTPENDNYPFIHDDGSLYFSSTGRLGMGGLDIYKAEYKGEDKWANITNLKYPINSAGDDFGIIFEGNKEKGYLSSNREGSKGGLDIW